MSKVVKKPELGKFITVRVTPKFHTQHMVIMMGMVVSL